MIDPFSRLGVEPRLALSEDELRLAFREAGKREHPDGGGSGDGFRAVQEAFGTLSSPSRRLRAWIGLKGIAGDERGAISPELVDLFGKVGTVMQRAEEVAKRRNAAMSALAKAMLEPEVQLVREAIESSQQEVAAALDAKVSQFPDLEAGEGDPWRVARVLAFLEKWQAGLKAKYAALW